MNLQRYDVLIHYQSPARRSAIHHIFTKQNGEISEACTEGNYCKREGKLVLCRRRQASDGNVTSAAGGDDDGLICEKDGDVE